MILIVKALVSTLIILGVNVVAQRAPTLGGWIASLPIISVLSIMWLLLDGKLTRDISQFLIGVLLGLIPTALLLSGFAYALKRGVAVPLAALCGLLLWAGTTWLARRMGWLG